jgi:hypothetical protein
MGDLEEQSVTPELCGPASVCLQLETVDLEVLLEGSVGDTMRILERRIRK